MKTIKSILFLALLFLAFNLVADNHNKFPIIRGETLYDETINIPSGINGKFTIIGIASSKKAEAALRTWMQPVYDLFINQNTFIPIDYNVDIYFVPVFSGVNKTAYNSVKKKTKQELDKELFPYVLFYKGNLDEYKNKLKIKDKSKPHFYVINQKRNIVYTTSGDFTQKKLDKMESLVLE